MGNHQWEGDIYLCVPPTKMLGGRVPTLPPIIAAPGHKSCISERRYVEINFICLSQQRSPNQLQQ